MHSGAWSPYVGSDAIFLAVVLFVITAALLYLAMRLPRPIAVKRPGASLGVLIIVTWVLAVATFSVAVVVYVSALFQQVGHVKGPGDPITPVTMISGAVAFFAIIALTQRSGFWVAVGCAVVGTIAAPMIFELPFDLIVMGHTFPPTPAVLFTLLFFLPLFVVETLSFAMLTLSPLMSLSRTTLFLLAGMFLIFAVWALFGFAYPSTPLPIALNSISKILAFATAVSLFLVEGNTAHSAASARDGEATPAQPSHASEVTS